VMRMIFGGAVDAASALAASHIRQKQYRNRTMQNESLAL
jgi:hypothetical protein